MEGYIKLHRQILDSRVWANDGLLKVWLWCLLKANYKDNWVTVKTGSGETEVKVKKGQFIFGRKSAGKSLKMPPSTVWKRILKLENMQNLNTQRDTHYTIISIMNWDTYQDEDKKGDTQGDRQGTGREQAGNTDKKDKKDNKEIIYRVVAYLNEKTGKNFKTSTEDTVKKINARLAEGYTEDEFKMVIDIKVKEWIKDPKMSKYLCPETLFRPSRFEKYLNEAPVEQTFKPKIFKPEEIRRIPLNHGS